LKRYRTRSR